MTLHTHDGGQLVDRRVDYDHAAHHQNGDAGLLTVTGVPAAACDFCDENWFDDAVGFALSRFLSEHQPGPEEILSIERLPAHSA